MENDAKIDQWHDRSPIERRIDTDCRRMKSTKYLKRDRRERRTGNERRKSEERRDKWMRVGQWRSESVFDD